MSGHSHWAGIKHKKALIDAKRGKLWSKLARNVIVAAKAGGPDPAANLSLRYAIDKAKAVKKGSGDLGGANFEEIIYEGYGCNGVAVLCEVLTDNRNRTAGELRHIFDKRGGSLGATGCVAWIFQKKGLFTVSAELVDEDTLMELALEAGADDVELNDDDFEITCTIDAYEHLKQILKENEIETKIAEISQIPSNNVNLDQPAAKKILDLLEALEDHDDVQNVYANFDISPEILKQLET